MFKYTTKTFKYCFVTVDIYHIVHCSVLKEANIIIIMTYCLPKTSREMLRLRVTLYRKVSIVFGSCTLN